MPMVSFIKPFLDDPFIGHLGTMITISFFTGVFLKSLPAYREELTARARGLEIGFTHGYFIFGPFYTYGPLRPDNILTSTEVVPIAAGILTTITVIVILAVASSAYSDVLFSYYPRAKMERVEEDNRLVYMEQYDDDKVEPWTYFDNNEDVWREVFAPKDDEYSRRDGWTGVFDNHWGWRSFISGFLNGGIAGAIVAGAVVFCYALNSEFLMSSF